MHQQKTIHDSATDDDGSCYFSPDWTVVPTPASGMVLGHITVDAIAASEEDWIGAFTPDAVCAGATQPIVQDGLAYISLVVYGDDALTEGVSEGMNEGEDFTLQFFDASANVSYLYHEENGQWLMSGWTNTNGTPLPDYDDPSREFAFTSIPYEPECGDPVACNYQVGGLDPSACEYPEAGLDCDGNCLVDEDNDNVCDGVDPCVGQWMLAAFATVQVRFMHADAQRFQKAIATAMETSWMNVAFVVEPVFRRATAIVTEVNWTHWETAEEVALQIQITTAYATMSTHALEHSTLAAYATVQEPSTNAVVLSFHLPTAIAMVINWTRSVYAAAHVLLIPILTAFVTMSIRAWANTTNAVFAMEQDQSRDTIAMEFASKIATPMAFATNMKSRVASMNLRAITIPQPQMTMARAPIPQPGKIVLATACLTSMTTKSVTKTKSRAARTILLATTTQQPRTLATAITPKRIRLRRQLPERL